MLIYPKSRDRKAIAIIFGAAGIFIGFNQSIARQFIQSVFGIEDLYLSMVGRTMGAAFLFLAIVTMFFQELTAFARGPKALEGGLDDQPIRRPEDDRLGAGLVAKTLVNLLSNKKTSAPLTVAILGDWGTGKTSTMRLVAHEFGERRAMVMFNAWHFHEEGRLLAALMEHIRGQAVPPAFSLKNVRFRFRLFWFRGGNKLANAWSVTTLALLGALAGHFGWDGLPALGWWGAESVGGSLTARIYELFATMPVASLIASAGAGLSAALYVARYFLAAFPPALRRRLSLSLSGAAFDISPWASDAGIRYRFQEEFRVVACALGSGWSRDWTKVSPGLVICVDDLDRCEPTQIASTIATLNYLSSSEAPFFAVLAMDWNKVVDALSVCYATQADASVAKADTPRAKNLARRRYAEAHLEKIVQIRVDLAAATKIPVNSLKLAEPPGALPTMNYWAIPVVALAVCVRLVQRSWESVRLVAYSSREWAVAAIASLYFWTISVSKKRQRSITPAVATRQPWRQFWFPLWVVFFLWIHLLRSDLEDLMSPESTYASLGALAIGLLRLFFYSANFARLKVAASAYPVPFWSALYGSAALLLIGAVADSSAASNFGFGLFLVVAFGAIKETDWNADVEFISCFGIIAALLMVAYRPEVSGILFLGFVYTLVKIYLGVHSPLMLVLGRAWSWPFLVFECGAVWLFTLARSIGRCSAPVAILFLVTFVFVGLLLPSWNFLSLTSGSLPVQPYGNFSLLEIAMDVVLVASFLGVFIWLVATLSSKAFADFFEKMREELAIDPPHFETVLRAFVPKLSSAGTPRSRKTKENRARFLAMLWHVSHGELGAASRLKIAAFCRMRELMNREVWRIEKEPRALSMNLFSVLTLCDTILDGRLTMQGLDDGAVLELLSAERQLSPELAEFVEGLMSGDPVIQAHWAAVFAAWRQVARVVPIRSITPIPSGR